MQKVKLDSYLFCFEDAGYCMGTADSRGSVLHGVQQPIITVIVMQDKQRQRSVSLRRCDDWEDSRTIPKMCSSSIIEAGLVLEM